MSYIIKKLLKQKKYIRDLKFFRIKPNISYLYEGKI